MFSLVMEQGKYLRVRGRVKKEDIISAFSCHVGDVFCGAVIEISAPKRYCYALAGDTYAAVAARERVDERELRELNFNKIIYPTLRIWLP
ncbi:MAG: hypothetical protein K2J61_03735 [Clostridia bacterium]|nr:hypothetical protein [Clostridia bacterium]